MKNSKNFCSKILLFGEYSIISGSRALAVRYADFEGKLMFHSSKHLQHATEDSEFKEFAQYLENLILKKKIDFSFDISSFKFDVGQGLYFDSTIPQGFGVGSSGALCAALFYRYGQNNEKKSALELKNIFSILESHFHGSSSGIDPLISYLDSSILINSDNDLVPVELPDYSKGTGAIFLLNTKRPRRTEPLVNLYLEKTKAAGFVEEVQRRLLPVTHNCIDSFIDKDIETLFANFKELSKFQIQHMSPMIPKLYVDTWQQGLDSNEFYLKLCGAGGGGFLLGITKDLSTFASHFSGYEIKPVFYF